MNCCPMVCLNNQCAYYCARLQLENRLMGLKELRVLHWQSLAGLGLEKNIQTHQEKPKQKQLSQPNLIVKSPQHHPYLVFAAIHDEISGSSMQM